MYASKRSVAKAQNTNVENSRNYHMNKFRHRGAQRSYLQVTPDGKHIQHYVVDSRTAAFKKEMKKAYEEAQAKKTQEPTRDLVNE